MSDTPEHEKILALDDTAAIDPAREYKQALETLDSFLGVGDGPSSFGLLRQELEASARRTRRAHTLSLRARQDCRRVEAEVEHQRGSLRRAGLDHLKVEVAAGRLNAQRVTNDLIEWTAAELAPAAWAALGAKLERAKAVRDSCEELHARMVERGKNLRALLGSPDEDERRGR